MKHYSVSLKEQAVQMHLVKGITMREIMEQLGIVSSRRIRIWCDKYRKEGQLGLESKPKGHPKKNVLTEQESTEYELTKLRMENELLRNFLSEIERR